jgi:D-alanyl-D-alanine carboxypeptidase/D-alanyl-D-alanine-endopeptidase (penicillin-binding protein 4)
MKSIAALFLIFVIAFHQAEGVAEKAAPTENNEKIHDTLNPPGLLLAQSVMVVRIADNKVLFSLDPTKIVAPASVSKIVTAAAALVKFGPSKTFNTRFYRTGELKNGVVLGDLIVVGDGDSYLVSEKLWQMAADLRNMGVKEIRGNIVIDNSLFDEVSRDELRIGAVKGSSHAYDAPVSALGVNFNTIAVAMAPGNQIGSPAYVNLDPYAIQGVVIDNQLRTSAKKIAAGINLTRLTLGDGRQRLSASGVISADQAITKLYRSVSDNVQSSGEQIRSFLKSEGLTVPGKVRAGILPKGAALLYELESYPLSKVIDGLNHFSNNYVADVLIKRLGAAFPRTGTPDAPGQGSFENGMAVVTDFLKNDVGIKDKFIMKNGSGLTTENRISADQLCKVLTYLAKGLDVFPEFLASLSASGLNGTLEKRFGKQDTQSLQGKVRAKTGTLSEPISVSSLAGYVYHPVHGLLAFAILQNGVEGKKQPGIDALRNMQDHAIADFLKYL